MAAEGTENYKSKSGLGVSPTLLLPFFPKDSTPSVTSVPN
jgi:hypothetical protein